MQKPGAQLPTQQTAVVAVGCWAWRASSHGGHMHCSAPDTANQHSAASGNTVELAPDVLERTARLIGDGQIDWPAGLTPAQEQRLLDEVRRLRRARLVRFIASGIAIDIARDRRGA
jgi:hypothetical protein